MTRRQFVLDKKSNRTLDRLAAEGDGNYSAIVRRGIELAAEEQAILEATENDPGFIKMMEESEKAFLEGRWTSYEDVKKMMRARRKKAS